MDYQSRITLDTFKGVTLKELERAIKLAYRSGATDDSTVFSASVISIEWEPSYVLDC